MRAVITRVTEASVRIDGAEVSRIGPGLLVLLGVSHEDTPAAATWLADRIAALRIFADDAGKMNRSVRDIGGEVLVVSQFTLYGDCSRGRRPSFIDAARPEVARPLYEAVCDALGATRGVFGADMAVHSINDGPVTLIVDAP